MTTEIKEYRGQTEKDFMEKSSQRVKVTLRNLYFVQKGVMNEHSAGEETCRMLYEKDIRKGAACGRKYSL